MNAKVFLEQVKNGKINYNDYLYRDLEYSTYAESIDLLLISGESLDDIEHTQWYYVGKDFHINYDTKQLFIKDDKSILWKLNEDVIDYIFFRNFNSSVIFLYDILLLM